MDQICWNDLNSYSADFRLEVDKMIVLHNRLNHQDEFLVKEFCFDRI